MALYAKGLLFIPSVDKKEQGMYNYMAARVLLSILRKAFGQMKDNRLDAGKTAGIVGIISNIFLFGVKVFVGIITGSVSVIADAINNLSDAGSSVFVFVGYHMSGKPADKEHPYGHARIEYLCGLFISVIITVLGIELLRDSGEKLFTGGGSARFDALSVGIMLFTMAVKGAMAAYYRIVAKKIDSQALLASSVDSLGDIFATGAVVVGMVISRYTGPLTDAVLGCLIAIYIIVMGLKLTRDSSQTLIGVAPDAEFVADVARKIRQYEGIIGIHDLVVHSYGANRYFMSAHAEVDADADIMKSHDMVDNIENDFREKYGIELVIHMDPVQHSDPKVNEIRGEVAEIVSHIAAECSSPASMHDFRVVFGITHSNLIFDVAVTEGFPMTDEELCREISDEVKKLSESYNTVITVDRDYTTCRFGEKME